MSFMLLASSIVHDTADSAEEFRPETAIQEAGAANGRALAYLAHFTSVTCSAPFTT